MKTETKKIITNKLCRGCGEIRPIDEFHKDRTRGDGYKAQCTTCRDKKRDKAIATRKLVIQKSTIEDRNKAEARRIALKRLVAMHEREFLKFASEEYRRLQVPAKWHSLNGEIA